MLLSVCCHQSAIGERNLQNFDVHRDTDMVEEDGCAKGPAAIHSYMSRVMYNRRSKGNPLWNAVVLGGIEDGKR
jgi:20S proteasome subunit beta 7